MIIVTATKFRNNLFGYLDKVAKGETIAIQRNKQEVARIISPPKADWRENLKDQPILLVSPEEIIQSIDDIWEEYI
jgi:prevent-host-death family protein